MLKYIMTLVLAAAILAGCKSSPEIAYTAPPLAEEWTVSMEQSGGIMGMLRSIKVASDGNYIVTDERTHTTATRKLAENQLAELQGLVSNMEFTPPEIPGVCADCFVYEVDIESGGGKMIVNVDDVALPTSGLESLVDFLRNIMDSALQ